MCINMWIMFITLCKDYVTLYYVNTLEKVMATKINANEGKNGGTKGKIQAFGIGVLTEIQRDCTEECESCPFFRGKEVAITLCIIQTG